MPASANVELARIFTEMAAVLEITGANVFRVNAHKNVARIIADLSSDVGELVKADPAGAKAKLTAIDGIGDGSAKKIIEYCQTGKVAEHDELLKLVPPGLIQVMAIPGVGPKTAKILWEKGGVTDLESLKARLAAPAAATVEEGGLAGIPKIGEKTLENIRQSMEFVAKASERMRLGQAMPLAENLVEMLRQTPGVKRLEYAGSLRRGCETIGDIDLLAATADQAATDRLQKTFAAMPMIEKVLASGETKTSVRLGAPHSVQVDLRIVPEDSFGAAWLYFTGSKQHNIVLREKALKKKLTLNDYGLFPDDGKDAPHKRGVKSVAGKTEAEIYKKFGMEWIPPELREARGEFDLSDGPPKLIEIADIKAELHAHTNASDGHFTIEELIAAAKERGYHTIAITDHSKSSVQANGLSPDRLLKHIDAIHEAGSKAKGINVLAGAEVDILIDGRLDYEDDLLAKLDIVVASPHASLKQDPEKATKRLLAAIRHPLVHIIGHPTGRYINRREGLSPDIHAMIEAAVEHETALEINANHVRLDLRDTHVKAAVDAGALIAIDTDAHGMDDFDELRYGILTARRGWLTAEGCVNTWTAAKLRKWLKSKR